MKSHPSKRDAHSVKILPGFLLFSLVLVMGGVALLHSALAATYTWTQSSWSGGASSTITTHNPDAQNNTTGWTYFSTSSNASRVALVGNTIKISSTTTSSIVS